MFFLMYFFSILLIYFYYSLDLVIFNFWEENGKLRFIFYYYNADILLRLHGFSAQERKGVCENLFFFNSWYMPIHDLFKKNSKDVLGSINDVYSLNHFLKKKYIKIISKFSYNLFYRRIVFQKLLGYKCYKSLSKNYMKIQSSNLLTKLSFILVTKLSFDMCFFLLPRVSWFSVKGIDINCLVKKYIIFGL